MLTRSLVFMCVDLGRRDIRTPRTFSLKSRVEVANVCALVAKLIRSLFLASRFVVVKLVVSILGRSGRLTTMPPPSAKFTLLEILYWYGYRVNLTLEVTIPLAIRF